MKLVNSRILLTAACALSLAMGAVGTGHAAGKGKGPQFSIDVEVFCGDPTAKEYDMDGIEINDFGTNAAVRVTDVSNDNQVESPEVAVDIMCLAAVKDGPGKPELVQFDGEPFPSDSVEGANVYTSDCDLTQLPPGATEWKVTALVTGEQLNRDKFDSCEEVAVQ